MRRIPQCRPVIAAAIAGALLFSGSIASAESDSSVEASALSKLASPKDENPSGTLINEHNLGEYELLVVPELEPLVKAGEMPLTAFRSLRVSGSLFDARWDSASAEQAALPDVLSSAEQQGFSRAFPYPAASAIIDNGALSIAQQTAQLLWNAQAPLAGFASSGVDFTLVETSATQAFSLKGSLQRIVPRRFRAEDKTGQLFRERLRVESPQLLRGLSWLTFRFVNQQEDVVWAYSPAIKKTRQITSTNRSDAFLGTPIAADDLFGFSGKIQMLDGISVATLQGLAPFLSLDSAALKPDGGCLVVSPERKRRAPGGGVSAGAREAGVVQIGQEMNFVPRDLVRIELLQRDPYSIYGRQIIYLDKETFAPFYKIVFDRSGALAKIVITAHLAASSTDGAVKTVLPALTQVRIPGEKRSATVSYDRLRVCEETDTVLSLGEFDPRGIAQIPEVVPAPKIASPVAEEREPVKLVAPNTTAAAEKQRAHEQSQTTDSSAGSSGASLTFEDIP